VSNLLIVESENDKIFIEALVKYLIEVTLMEIQQIAERITVLNMQLITGKIFNFCKEKYPYLKWNLDSENNIIQCPLFPDELIIDVFLDGQLYRVSCEAYYVGGFELWINPDDRDNNRSYENKIVFDYIERSKRDYFDNKYRETRKVMLDIFNFILDEIQE
jgi:hypothetical protein